MRKSRITFDIETAKVRTIVELLIDQVSNFTVSEIAESVSTLNGPRALKMPEARANQEWLKSAAVDLATLMKTKPDKEWHYLDAEIGELMRKRGYSVTVSSQVLSALVGAGRVNRTKRGHYRIVSL